MNIIIILILFFFCFVALRNVFQWDDLKRYLMKSTMVQPWYTMVYHGTTMDSKQW